jgi:hypothetical protein
MTRADPKNGKNTWRKLVINEHEKPLSQVWQWMRENHGSLQAEDVLTELKEWPVVVVTKEEDERLRPLKDVPPTRRYEEAGIEVWVCREGKWGPR